MALVQVIRLSTPQWK